ncbi:hypothetical protein PoB_007288100 [Plakobranchus ocellatus]|uniref:Uncharacterized protein n=1 Tax=Plakobranchus ocellatus TaxID=259542 RepID=A0AAV4DR50_9GAST|nr:hypothetical protein PoB_007288100 [Plakobranchus ocellatus]
MESLGEKKILYTPQKWIQDTGPCFSWSFSVDHGTKTEKQPDRVTSGAGCWQEYQKQEAADPPVEHDFGSVLVPA